MKMYTREEVIEQIKEFQELLAREKTLQDELLTIQLHGDSETLARNQERHDELIAEIEELRFKKMLPILEEMGTFIKECQKIEAEEKKKAEEAPEGQE